MLINHPSLNHNVKAFLQLTYHSSFDHRGRSDPSPALPASPAPASMQTRPLRDWLQDTHGFKGSGLRVRVFNINKILVKGFGAAGLIVLEGLGS